jgi:ABC-type iron transport system FetAB permease component
MKNFLKFAIIIGVFLSIYIMGERMVNIILPNHQTIANSSLLFVYGGMVGYMLFIIFVAILQSEGFRYLKDIKPKTALITQKCYQIMTVLFVMYPFFNFDLQFSILMALTFMLLTAALDMIREKIIQVHDGNTVHPKKIV